jgi:hypothetical protein
VWIIYHIHRCWIQKLSIHPRVWTITHHISIQNYKILPHPYQSDSGIIHSTRVRASSPSLPIGFGNYPFHTGPSLSLPSINGGIHLTTPGPSLSLPSINGGIHLTTPAQVYEYISRIQIPDPMKLASTARLYSNSPHQQNQYKQ